MSLKLSYVVSTILYLSIDVFTPTMKELSLNLLSLIILQVHMHRLFNTLCYYYYCSYYWSMSKYQVFIIQNIISSSLLKTCVPPPQILRESLLMVYKNLCSFFLCSSTNAIRLWQIWLHQINPQPFPLLRNTCSFLFE